MRTSKYGTDYLESEAILAAQEGDAIELSKLLARMSYSERNLLQDACRRLDKVIEQLDPQALMESLEQGWITQAEFDACMSDMVDGGI